MVYRLVIKHLIVLEKNADRLSVVNTTDRLGKNAANLENLEFWASSLVSNPDQVLSSKTAPAKPLKYIGSGTDIDTTNAD